MKTTLTPTPLHHGLSAMAGVAVRLLTAIARIPDQLYSWQARARQRHHLMTVDERLLKDMGISRYDALREGSKPFWKD